MFCPYLVQSPLQTFYLLHVRFRQQTISCSFIFIDLYLFKGTNCHSQTVILCNFCLPYLKLEFQILLNIISRYQGVKEIIAWLLL